MTTIAELLAKGADNDYLDEMIGVECKLVEQSADEVAELVGFDYDPEFPVRVRVTYLDRDGNEIGTGTNDYRATHVTVDEEQADALPDQLRERNP